MPVTTERTIKGNWNLRSALAQLEKEGFPSEGKKDYLHSVGAPSLWMQSLNTGHGTSLLVRQRLDAFLKEWGDKGRTSPDHLRFVTYTTRYDRDYWASVEGMDKHYERAGAKWKVDSNLNQADCIRRTRCKARLTTRFSIHS